MNTRIKRVCAWILTVVLLISILPVNVLAADFEDSFPESVYETLRAFSEIDSSIMESPLDFPTAGETTEQTSAQEEPEPQLSDSEGKEEVPAKTDSYFDVTYEASEDSSSEAVSAQPFDNETEQEIKMADELLPTQEKPEQQFVGTTFAQLSDTETEQI